MPFTRKAGMASHLNRSFHFVHRQLSLLSFLCLFVLLPQVYYAHLSKSILPASSENYRAGIQVILSPTAEPGPHQPESCPKCRTAGIFQDHAFSSLPDARLGSPRLPWGLRVIPAGWSKPAAFWPYTPGPAPIPLTKNLCGSFYHQFIA